MRYQHPKNLEFQTTHSHVANGLAAVDGRSPPTPNKGRIGPKKGQRKEVPILSVWQYANIQAVCRISILEPHLSRLKRNGRSSNEVKTNLRDWRRSKWTRSLYWIASTSRMLHTPERTYGFGRYRRSRDIATND